MSKNITEDFSKLFQDAEKSVSGIKNERLREIAFEKLISHLLTNDLDKDDDEEKSEKTSHKKVKSHRSSPKRRGPSTSKKEGPLTWIKELIDEGFFKKPKSSNQIREELETRSHHLKATDLTRPLEALCHDKFLKRNKIASEKGGKPVLHWVNW